MLNSCNQQRRSSFWKEAFTTYLTNNSLKCIITPSQEVHVHGGDAKLFLSCVIVLVVFSLPIENISFLWSIRPLTEDEMRKFIPTNFKEKKKYNSLLGKQEKTTLIPTTMIQELLSKKMNASIKDFMYSNQLKKNTLKCRKNLRRKMVGWKLL